MQGCVLFSPGCFGTHPFSVYYIQGMKHRLFDNGVEPVRSEHWQVDVNDFVSYFKRGGGLESVENVLAAARQMAATELACTPTVRRLLREVYMKHAVVTTNPTDTGEEVSKCELAW